MGKMKKVCIVIYSFRRGGIEMSALSFYKRLKNKYSFIFYIQNAENNDKEIEKSVLKNGDVIVQKPAEVKNRIDEYKFLCEFFKKEKIDIVHAHMGSHCGLVMKAAYKAGVKKRISHSHMANNNRKIGIVGKCYRKAMRFYINKYATDKLACSESAGMFICGKKFADEGTVINNGIEISQYKYNFSLRTEKRKELNLDNEAFVIGHIGSVYYIKNQSFLVKIFNEIKKNIPNSILILCGEERDDGETRTLVKELELENDVKFLGIRADIPELLLAIDVLIFPSLFEGLPIVPIEAQATGLPCLLSDRIITEVKKNKNVEFMSLDAPYKEWAQKAIELSRCERENISTTELEKNYDIKNVAKQLEKIYEE